VVRVLYTVSLDHFDLVSYPYREFYAVYGVAGFDLLQDTPFPFGVLSSFVKAPLNTLKKVIMLFLRHKKLFWRSIVLVIDSKSQLVTMV